MPLKQGSSRKVISENIRTEMHEGKPQNKRLPLLCQKRVKAKKKSLALAQLKKRQHNRHNVRLRNKGFS